MAILKHVLTFLTALLLVPLVSLKAAANPANSHPPGAATADVIVYGSTPGGFCAAIAAAREGASVILLEPTQHVGGLSTGGLSHCDSNQMRRETLMGLFDEWHTRIVKDYTDRGLPAPYDAARKDTAKWTFEPHVAMRVTMAMLKEAGVTVKTGRYLKSVTKEGPRITSLVTQDGTFQAKVFVDGSYEGDLMAAAGVDWTIGREGRAEFGESHAGKQYPKKKMEISGFDDAGNLLPLVTTSDAGPDDAGDKNIMTYSFRLCLTRDPAKMAAIPEPDHYNPARFELARRALKAGAKVGFDLYPLPGGKIDGNNSIHGQISLGLVGGCNTWHSADEAGRAKIWENHKQYTLEFIHFLRNDPDVPPKVRSEYSKLGFCKDEFADTGHFPPALYVRESRRMKGPHVISQKDIIDSPEKDDPIAISSFPIDSHDCQRVALKDGGVINEGTIMPVRVPGTGVGYAYHVPYRSVLPQASQCDNLLVPVALSCTHVAISSLRIEGAWMAIGQGAGVAAALAAKQGVTVQDLPYPVLRERLLAQGQVLTLPAATVKAADVLSIRDGRFHLDGKPFAEISFNKFDLLWQLYDQRLAGKTLDDANPMVQAQNKALRELHEMGFRTIRFFGLPWGPAGAESYADPQKRELLYEALDKALALCEKHDIRVVWCLAAAGFTDTKLLPDKGWVHGEEQSRELMSNPETRGRKLLYRYIDETVTRYKNRKAVLMWEIGNEITLLADIGDYNGERMPTLKDLAGFYRDVTKRIKAGDPLRLVSSGGSHMRESQWNIYQGKGWAKDTFEEQFKCFDLLYGDTGVDVIDVHSYMNHKQGYVISDGAGGETLLGNKEWMQIARRIGKPLMIGELGLQAAAKTDTKTWKETPNYFESYADTTAAKPWVEKALNSVIEAGIPLSYWWCYQSDRPMDQNDPQRFDLTRERNPELLDCIIDANRRLRDKLTNTPPGSN